MRKRDIDAEGQWPDDEDEHRDLLARAESEAAAATLKAAFNSSLRRPPAEQAPPANFGPPPVSEAERARRAEQARQAQQQAAVAIRDDAANRSAAHHADDTLALRSSQRRWRNTAVFGWLLCLFLGIAVLQKPNTPPTGSGFAVLQLRLNPDAPAGKVQNLLQRWPGRLLDGPGAIGVYQLSVPRSAVARALQQGRAHPELIDSIEAR